MFEGLTWLAPLVVLAAGIRSSPAALTAFAALLPLFGTSRGGPYQSAFDAASIVAIACSFRERRPQRSGLDVAVLAFLAVAIASFFPLVYHPPSWRLAVLRHLPHALGNAETWSPFFSWRAMLDLLLGCGLYFAARRTFAERSRRPLAWGVAAGLIFVIVLGLAEVGGLVSLGRYRVSAFEGRMQSLFFNPGWLAEYVAIGFPFAASALFAASGVVRGIGYALVPLSLSTLLLTRQRGGWMALGGECVAVLLLLPRIVRDQPQTRRIVRIVAASTALLAVVALAVRPSLVPSVMARLTESGLSLRTYLWEAALKMFQTQPLLGWGIGTYHAAIYRLYPVSGASEAVHGEAHNTLLHIAAERGTLGIWSLVLLVLGAWASVRDERRRDDGDLWTASGRAVTLVGVAVFSLVQYVWHVPPVGALLWLVLGCCRAPIGSRLDRAATRAGLVLAAAALLLIPWRIFAGQPLEAAGDRSLGFHRAEEREGERKAYEWTEGYAARRFECEGNALVLEIANGRPNRRKAPAHVRVTLDGRRVAELDVTTGFQEVRTPMREACMDGVAVLEIAVTPTFRPFTDRANDTADGPAPDERELGVVVRGIHFESPQP